MSIQTITLADGGTVAVDLQQAALQPAVFIPAAMTPAQVVSAQYTPPPPPPPAPVALGIYTLNSKANGWRDSYASEQGLLTGTVPGIVHQFWPLYNTAPRGGSTPADFVAGSLLDWATDACAAGSFPLLTWEWRDMSLAQTGPQPAVSCAAILAGNWDAYAMAQLGKVKAWLDADPTRRIGFRLFHEMNGLWYPWSCAPGNANGNLPYQYIGAHRHVYGLMQQAFGADMARVSNVWTPGTRGTGWMDFADCFPGANSVTHLGADIYNGDGLVGGWLDFGTAFAPFYDRLCRLDPDLGIVLVEMGCDESATHDKAAWYAALTGVPAQFPRVRALVEFDRVYAGAENYAVSLSPNPAVYPAWKALCADPLCAGRWG